MGIKRSSPDTTEGARSAKKHKKTITVGPANLPDGQWKRRNQRIKHSLVTKAKLRQQFEKLKSRDPEATSGPAPELRYYEQAEAEERARGAERHDQDLVPNGDAEAREVTNAPHPDRQAMIDREPSPPALPQERRRERGGKPLKRPKSVPFAKEHREATERKRIAEERRTAREKAERERRAKIEEREKFRRAMAKARMGGKNGQRKLGRESGVLLDRVKRIVAGGE